MSKNIKLNDTNYNGVSTVQLPTTDGGNATFKDVDEITTPSGTKTITTNGTHDVKNYASANVNIPTPSGSKTITENGTHDVTNYAQAIVNVASSGGSGNDYKSMVNGLVDGSYSGTIVLDESVTKIRASAFSGVPLTSIEMPNVKEIGSDAFSGCKSLVITELPNGVEIIGQGAFYGCYKANITEIPASVKEIQGSYTFSYIESKTLTFKGTPTLIGANALSGMETLNVPWGEGEVANAPWGANTVNYNYTGE